MGVGDQQRFLSGIGVRYIVRWCDLNRETRAQYAMLQQHIVLQYAMLQHALLRHI